MVKPLREITGGLSRFLRSKNGTAPFGGLSRYVFHPPGGVRQLHFRTDADGSAVLLIDVGDAIHLNPTAALLVRAALEENTPEQAVARLRRRFRGIDPEAVRSDVAAMYRLVERLRTGTDACPTCGLAECGRAALFSMPVSAPYKVDLALTYGCNNACGHCYNGLRRAADQRALQKTPRDGGPGGETKESLPITTPATAVAGRCSAHMNVSQWKRVLKKLARLGVPHVIFTGGEPTLFPGLCELIHQAGRRGLVSGLNTNGRRLANPDFTGKLRRAGLDHVQITLESCRAEVHNAMTGAESFAETVSGIRCALGAGLHAITNTTLTRRNADHALEIVAYLDRLGIQTFAVNGMICAGGGVGNDTALTPEDLAAIVPPIRDAAQRRGMRFLWYTPTPYCRFSPLEFDLGPRRCNAGQYSMCIEPDGGVLPCQSYPVAVGNILRDPWDALWNSGLFLRFRERNDNPQAAGLPEPCWTCPDLPVCGGGCPLERTPPREQAACGLATNHHHLDPRHQPALP
ncbi:MAG: PqqD family peptide modification chaperone [Pirellulales bacterium]|nr:PqqD family peptide modification chaperone [Pirellulales bacterium]